ncbi:hypothetical protein EYZ11_005910 [Aspergillus tanneri]|uniref:Mediator of RNA polymerase II transcription subunit 13 n=1 Tax=Aspergillus tanneri TaxID=1220188 RepID=A0A4S3JH46_9EURO|nr:hypothetical protein EYZ11_005910 [Aspergillus tanneri]
MPGEAPANGYTILKHLSRLKSLELRLRSLNCLVSSYPRRLGLWVFSATPDFESLIPLCSNDGKDEQNRLSVGASTLKVSASGSITSWEIVKNLSADSPNGTGVSSAPQRSQNASTPVRRMDGYSSSATIYASFISAVTGALNLHLVRHNNAIPLGSRSLFTAVDRDCYENLNAANSDLSSALTTLQVQLTPAGKLTVTLQMIAQPGIARLCQPEDDATAFHSTSPGSDLWLSPSGSIARLVTTNPGTSNASSPYPPGEAASTDGEATADGRQWKDSVLEWLENFGLAVDSVDNSSWVEVEVWEPFYSRLAGETWRLGEENTSSLPLKRILWPAVFCFKRVKSTPPDILQTACSPASDPLDFAQKWHETEMPGSGDMQPKQPSNHQEQQSKNDEIPPAALDLTEGLESLSRASQYPELQTASLVYPTPPDGAAAMGLNNIGSSDAVAEDTYLGLSLTQAQNKQRAQDHFSVKDRSDGDVPMSFGPSAGLVVGSGLYDTNEDDDLFGDINERDFGAKGITDEDFSFFDDPGFGHMADSTHDVAQTIANIEDSNEPEMQAVPIENTSPEAFALQETPAEHIEVPNTGPLHNETAKPDREIAPSDGAMHQSPPDEQNQTIISPPLSPVDIKKILFPGPSGDTKPLPKQSQVQSYYNPVVFKQNMSTWNQKYGIEGKFWFTITHTRPVKKPINSLGDIPTVGPPRRHRNISTAGGISKTFDGHASPPSDADQLCADSDTSSVLSDDSNSAASTTGASPTTFSPRKRKRACSNSDSSLALSQDKQPGDLDQELSVRKAGHSTFLGNFLSTFSDWSMTGYFSFSENQIFPVLISKEIQVQVAQILVDQVTQSSLDHKLDRHFGLSDLDDRAHSVQTFLEDTAFMNGMERLDLNGFVSLQDSNSLSPAASIATSRQTLQRRETGKGSILKLSPPHLRVRRGKEYLEILPPAATFWETFGLEPVSGPKDIAAYCIHPSCAAEAANTFLERLGLLYSSCNLGMHARGEVPNAFERGLGSWNVGSFEAPDYLSIMQSLKTICEELGMLVKQFSLFTY